MTDIGRVVPVFDNKGTWMNGTITQRHANGSVTVVIEFGPTQIAFRAEAIAAYRLCFNAPLEPSLGDEKC